jgi:homoserine kinase type II
MAAKSALSRDDFTEILSNYALGEYRASQPISAGTVQTNFLLQTTKGEFVFRYYENRSSKSILFEINLIRYLRNKHYPCPAPFKNRHGSYVNIYNAKPYVMFEFVEGYHIENPNESQRRQLIKKVAELHTITKNYRPINKAHRWNYSIELCEELAQREVRKIATPNAQEKLMWLRHELSNLRLPKSLPKGICHCDFHFSNILFKDGEFHALLDFDDANYTFLTFDLATLIDPFMSAFQWNTWNTFRKDEKVLDFKYSRDIIFEYIKYRPLNINEKRHFFDVYKLSIMFDCVWYFGRGDAIDFYERRKVEYLNAIGRDEFYNKLFGAE